MTFVKVRPMGGFRHAFHPFHAANLQNDWMQHLHQAFNGENNFGGWQNRLTATPAVNVSETDAAYHIEVAAPGLQKEAFGIKVEKDVLTISATVDTNDTDTTNPETKTAAAPEVRSLRREFTAGSFSRSFRIGETIDTEHITATYTDGILSVVLPKKAPDATLSRVISVN